MSIENINISRDNVQGKCDLKCSYNFKYNESNLTATNKDVMIRLTYDNSNTAHVLYNNQKYNVSNISIMSPSIHIFNGSKASAEIIIEHIPITGGPILFVAIPIISSSDTSNSTTIVTEIIQRVAMNAPSNGNSTNLKINGFTLDKIVPIKPFYSYTDNDKNEWIVFDILEALTLNNSTLATLGKIIKPYPLKTLGNGLFYNSSGPNTTGNIGDGIYISCKPTGSSEEEIGVQYSKNVPTYDLSNILSNSTVILIIQIISGCFIFIIIFVLISYLYGYISNDKPKMSQFMNS